MTPARYRYESVHDDRETHEVDAVQVTEANAAAVVDWVNGQDRRHRPAAFWGRDEDGRACVHVPYLGGDLLAPVGDWVIRADTGTFTPVEAESFALGYTPVEVSP